MKTIEGALQGNDTPLNVHCKRKRARWRMIASKDDTNPCSVATWWAPTLNAIS